jgi:hypothetical protein
MPELKLSRRGRLYAAFPSIPKATDNGFPARLVRQAGPFPITGCVTGTMGPRRDQATTGMCTGEGSTGMGMRLYRKVHGLAVEFAPEFTYAFERIREGTFDQGDVGAQVSTSLEVPDPAMDDTNCIGWCPTNVAGYVPLDITSKPSAAQIEAAKQYPGGAHHDLGNNIANVKSCILSDYTGVIGISVYESFEDDTTAASGLIPLPNLEREQFMGGHEMHSLLAFDDTIQCPNATPGAVLTENSWGLSWGAESPYPSLTAGRGLCWLPYDYLMDRRLTSDVKMGHLGKAW